MKIYQAILPLLCLAIGVFFVIEGDYDNARYFFITSMLYVIIQKVEEK